MKQDLPVFSNLSKFSNIFIAISTKKDGGMKDSNFNKEKFLARFSINPKYVISAGLTHGNNVKKVSKYDLGKVIENTDSIITNERKVFLSITTADCLSVFLYDPKKNAIGLIHAGWRGLVKNIIGKTIKQLEVDFRSHARDLIVGVGPGIGVCHFEVKKDVERNFGKYKEAIEKKDGKIFIDLKKVALMQLLKEGLKKVNIDINLDCTYHEVEKYFSYRRNRTMPLKAQLVVMGLV